jgi:hypothetical protein
MSSDEALEDAVASWRTKHHVREDDPMMAALDLVRVYLAHAPRTLPDSAEVPPTYGNFARRSSYWTAAQTPSPNNRLISSSSYGAWLTPDHLSTATALVARMIGVSTDEDRQMHRQSPTC